MRNRGRSPSDHRGHREPAAPERPASAGDDPRRAEPDPLTIVVERERGDTTRRVYEVRKARVTIGSGSQSDIVLADPDVSDVHCQLRGAHGNWRIQDLGSHGGTRVQGVAVVDSAFPAGDAILELGRCRLRVVRTPAGGFGALVGTSAVMARLFDDLSKIARSEANVLIYGAPGTGKDLVAREIVRHSPRSSAPFAVLRCWTLPPTSRGEELLEGDGPRAIARAGTLLLDEVDRLPLAAQSLLVRVADGSRVLSRDGRWLPPGKVRILATSSRDLWDEVTRGRFRLDLYFRLGVLGVRVPPLAERRGDLGLLAQTLARRGGHHGDVPPPTVAWLTAQGWPENLRDLAAWIEDELARPSPFQGDPGRNEGDAPALPSFADGKAHAIERFERAYVRRVLEAADGNVSLAARWAQLDRRHLHRLLQRRRPPSRPER